MPEKFSAIQNSDDFERSSESLIGNAEPSSLEQLNYSAQQRETQRKYRKKIENKEREKADIDLDSGISSIEISNEKELNTFLIEFFPNNLEAKSIAEEYFKEQEFYGFSISIQDMQNHILKFLNVENEATTEDKIKYYKEELSQQGKSQTEILQLLISKFENEKGVEKFIDNFRNFLKLHRFAESKPPAERQAIQKIISKADFTNETAFETSLAEISQNVEISNETKLEIAKEFGGAHIDSVDGMDYQLQQVKEHTQAIEKEIGVKSHEKSSLNLEIDELEDEIDKLPLDDTKRQELEEKLESRKEVLKQTKNEIERLEKGKPKGASFVLRQGFSAKLNADGSRSIKIDENFTIKIPSNRLPFTTTKNLRAINLTFPYKILKDLHIADTIFSPNLKNGSVPTKSQRDLGHLILSSLGIDDAKILSEENIKQLKKDLSKLNPKNGKSGLENMIEIGIYNVSSQSVNKRKLKEVLVFIHENRGLQNNILWDKINK